MGFSVVYFYMQLHNSTLSFLSDTLAQFSTKNRRMYNERKRCSKYYSVQIK